jgi:hypothetical protein
MTRRRFSLAALTAIGTSLYVRNRKTMAAFDLGGT